MNAWAMSVATTTFHPPPTRCFVKNFAATVLAFFVCLAGCEQRNASRTQHTVTFGTPDATDPSTTVPGPREQPADLGRCRIHHPKRSEDRDIAGWFQAVADDTTSTVTILSATLYGIKVDGTLEVISDGALTWAGYYSRSPWFPPGDPHEDTTPGMSFTVRQDRVLHGGSAHASLDGYVDVIYVMTVRTTGTARVQIGIDYRPSAASTGPGAVNERALSDWFAGDGVLRSTSDPRSPTPSCIPTFHQVVVHAR